MAELTGLERVNKFWEKEPLDKPPFFTGMGMLVLPAIKKLGYNFPSVHRNAERMAWAAIESARMYDFDCVTVPFDMCMESEALGNEISLYEDSEDILYPTIPYKNWTEVDQVEITEDDIANVMDRFPMNILPEAIQIIKNEEPDRAMGAWQLGPFTQCGQTIELDKVLKSVFKQKELVEKILDGFSDMIITMGKALIDAGADFITLREPGVAADLLSPRTFKEMIQPRLTRIMQGWGDKVPKVLHICGSTDPLVEMMWQCCEDSGGVAVSFDIKNDLRESRKKLEGTGALILGNWDVFKLPCAEETTVEESVAGMKENVEAGVDAVWPGCDMWPDIKDENFKAMVETVRTYTTGYPGKLG